MRRREARDHRLGEFWVEYEPRNLIDYGVFRVPEMFTAGFRDDRLRVLIEVVFEDEGPECVAISRLDHAAPALTSERRFPLRAMVSAAVRAVSFELVDVPIEQVDPDRRNSRLVPDAEGRVRVYVPAFDDSGAPRPIAEPAAPTGDERWQRVADLYRRALASGSAPSAAIADEFKVSRATARKWVQQARRRGFLGAAVGRRPGEVPSRSPSGVDQ